MLRKREDQVVYVPVVACGQKAEALVGNLADAGWLPRSRKGGFVPYTAGDLAPQFLAGAFATLIVADRTARRDSLTSLLVAARGRDNVILGAGLDQPAAAWLDATCDSTLVDAPGDPAQVACLARFLWSFLFTSLVAVETADFLSVLKRGHGIRLGAGRCDGPGALHDAGRQAAEMAKVGQRTPAVALSITTADSTTFDDIERCARAVAVTSSDETNIILVSTYAAATECRVELLAVAPLRSPPVSSIDAKLGRGRLGMGGGINE